ncbi:MAG: glycosyltransferase family 2 protein [Lentisphaerales bacterium]|jgi:GT2 family glycosyltransferase|nr:MAG: glycosyltransferase family 2 protein [Lentisphaerales bacterium]
MTNDLPLVWIVVLNWEDWATTFAALDAARHLAYSNRRVLLVDNGSKHVPHAELDKAYPEVALLTTKRNLGFAGGVNVGIRHALANKADFVWLLNNDTKPEPTALTELVQTAIAQDRAGVVGSAIYDIDSPDRLQSWGGGVARPWLGYCRHASGQNDPPEYITGASMLLRKEALQETGLFDEDFFFYWEDVDLCTRMRARGWQCVVASGSRVLHQLASTAGKTEYNRLRWLMSGCVRYLRLHHSLPLVPGLAGLLFQLTSRLCRMQLRATSGILRGWFEGWRRPIH